MRVVTAGALVLGLTGIGLAQHQHHRAPYADLQERTVKALSAEQLADLRAGRGMGLALAAELNGYPGPLHVVELSKELQLSEQQLQRMRQLTDQMRSEAVLVGEKLIQREQALETAFASQRITPTTLASLTAEIGETQGELRAVHLRYHLTTAELLTPYQKQRYAELRGYR